VVLLALALVSVLEAVVAVVVDVADVEEALSVNLLVLVSDNTGAPQRCRKIY
jgi:hypothetical protein